MKTADFELVSLLNSSTQYLQADLYTWTLVDGTIIRSTSWDRDLVAGGANLILQSGGDFPTPSPWSVGSLGARTGAVTGPDGVAGSASHYAWTATAYPQNAQASTPVVAGRPYSVAIWFKHDTPGALFSLVSNNGFIPINANMVASGGWQKYTQTAVANATGIANFLIVPDNSGVASTSGVSLARPQFSPGATPGIYVPTTTAAVDTRRTFSSSGLKIKRSKTRVVVGLEVDTLDLTVYPTSTDRIGALSFLAALNNGALDGAVFTLERAFLSDATTVVGTVTLFKGQVSEAEFSRNEARVKVKSWLELLNMNVPRNLYQSGCRATFGDSLCGVSKAAWTVAGAITGGSTNLSLRVTGLTQATGYFDQGVLQFTSGNLAGVKRTVRSFTSTSDPLVDVVALGIPLPKGPGYGDTFTICPGCDKTTGPNGCARYSNTLRFAGFPFIPVPETSR